MSGTELPAEAIVNYIDEHYTGAAHRTLVSGKLHPENVGYRVLYSALVDFVDAGQRLDTVAVGFGKTLYGQRFHMKFDCWCGKTAIRVIVPLRRLWKVQSRAHRLPALRTPNSCTAAIVRRLPKGLINS